MALEGKEDDAGKAQMEASQEAKISENVKEDEVVSKEDAEVGEGNREAQKAEAEDNKEEYVNEKDSEKGASSLQSSDGTEKENVKEREKDVSPLPPSDGNEKENGEETGKGDSSSTCDAKGGGDSSEEEGFLSGLKEYEKKALRELRSKVEHAILKNKLFKERKKVEKKEVTQEEKNSKEEKEELVEEKAKQERDAKEDENSDGGEKAEMEVEVEKDITLWGVPLLPSKGDKGTDVLLFKFLKAKEFKVNDAFEMLRNTLEWRWENKMDSIMEEDFGNEYDSVCYMRGLGREGHPVCYNVYGAFTDDEMYNKTFGTEASRERFLRWRLQLLEKEIQKLDFRPGGVSTLIQINDLKDAPGPSRKDLRLATKHAVEILQDNYPEFVARNIFINVPFWYYAFNALWSPFLTQRTKSKFVFSRPASVTETLLKYIVAEEIPVQYGGLRGENDPDFSTQDGASEVYIKAGATETIEIPAPEAGNTLTWDLSIVGWDVSYKEEFVPTDEGSYTIIVKKGRKISWQEEPIRNSFRNHEPGKVVITIENGMFKKKRVLYRYKTKNPSAAVSST